MPHANTRMTRDQRRRRDEEVAHGLFEMMNNKIVGASLRLDDRDRALLNHRSRDLNEIADYVESNEWLVSEQRDLAVCVLREAAANAAAQNDVGGPFRMAFEGEADHTGGSRPGTKPILARDNVRFAFFLLVIEWGISKNRARELIAENAGVSVETVKNTLGTVMNAYCDGVRAGRIPDPRRRG